MCVGSRGCVGGVWGMGCGKGGAGSQEGQVHKACGGVCGNVWGVCRWWVNGNGEKGSGERGVGKKGCVCAVGVVGNQSQLWVVGGGSGRWGGAGGGGGWWWGWGMGWGKDWGWGRVGGGGGGEEDKYVWWWQACLFSVV